MLKDNFLFEPSKVSYTGAQIAICAVVFAVVFSAAVYTPIARLHADIDHTHEEMKGLACEAPLTIAIVEALRLKLHPASAEVRDRLNGEMESLGRVCASFSQDLASVQKEWKDLSGLVKQEGGGNVRQKSLSAFIDGIQKAAETVPKTSGLILDTEERAYYLIAPAAYQVWYTSERLQNLLDGISSGDKKISSLGEDIQKKDIRVFETDLGLAFRGKDSGTEKFAERTKASFADYRARTLALIGSVGDPAATEDERLKLYEEALAATGKFWADTDENISRIFELRISDIKLHEGFTLLRGTLGGMLAAFCAGMAIRSRRMNELLQEHREFLKIIVSTHRLRFLGCAI